jgi:hypothetical protein
MDASPSPAPEQYEQLDHSFDEDEVFSPSPDRKVEMAQIHTKV